MRNHNASVAEICECMRMCGKEHKYNWYNQKKIIELFEENTRSNIRPVDVTQVIRKRSVIES